MADDIIERYGERVGYSESELERFQEEAHRVRYLRRAVEVATLYSIEAEVIRSRHCNSGYEKGQKFIMDVEGNFITKLCPKKMCVYLISQLTVPVALINERLSEGHEPNDFHFMRYVRCLDTGIECMGYGEVMLKVQAIPRKGR